MIENNVREFNNKYTTKNIDSFAEIEKWRYNKKINQYNIKPLSVEFEITNKCNQQCKHCGMSANQIVGKSKWKRYELEKLVDDLYDIGIPSISITGGEPFLEFENLCHTIEYSQGKIDIAKISSNGFWGKDPKVYFDKMLECGLLNNKFFVPCLLLPIGEQTIPLEYICNIINYICSNFKEDNIHIGITHIREHGDKSKVMDFIKLYEKTFEKFPKDRVYITEYYYINSSIMQNQAKVESRLVEEYLSEDKKCFNNCIGNNIMPKLFIKCSGECYSCVCFNVSKELKLGNYFENGLDFILEQLENNKYITFIEKNGINGFRNLIPNYVLRNTMIDNSCAACEFCIEYCKKYNII